MEHPSSSTSVETLDETPFLSATWDNTENLHGYNEGIRGIEDRLGKGGHWSPRFFKDLNG